MRSIGVAARQARGRPTDLMEPDLRCAPITAAIGDAGEEPPVGRQCRPERRGGHPRDALGREWCAYVARRRRNGRLGEGGTGRRGEGSSAALPPRIELGAFGVDASALFVCEPMHRQPFLAFPPLHRSNAAAKVGGDRLPRIEPPLWRSSLGGRGCMLTVLESAHGDIRDRTAANGAPKRANRPVACRVA